VHRVKEDIVVSRRGKLCGLVKWNALALPLSISPLNTNAPHYVLYNAHSSAVEEENK